mmetsp:Transcript_14953/g.21892  ORF Transcript_14953/g.21892 Transcript_14953/m.21892 type:complete len:116 (+) Transcript_14953:122-469(+)
MFANAKNNMHHFVKMLAILSGLVLLMKPSMAADHKRIYYDSTIEKYSSESESKILSSNIVTGKCVDRETEKGTVQVCLNLNATHSGIAHDVWIVKETGQVATMSIKEEYARSETS